MKSQSKKAFALLLVLGMCLALLPVSALAAPTDLSGTSDAFNWYSKGLPTEDAVYKAGDGTAEWDAETKTLTFTDATVGSRNGRISFPSNGNGTEISLVLKGDNVFEGSSIETGSCKVTVSGDGNLSLVMTSSSDGVYVGVSSGGGELIFAGTGTFSVSGSGNTPMQLYGGSVTSRLFLNVRERDHLCYYCSSSFQSFTGSMAVNSGVEHADAARAEKAILKELDDLRSGPITAEELEDCRRSLLSGMAGIEDTLGGIETWYYMEVLRGGPVQTPDDARAALQAVTEEDVRTVLRQLTLSVSYLLTREEESAHA